MIDGNMGNTGGIAGFNENALKAFERELKMGAIPFVESNFKVATDAKNRALAGLSMGGMQTLYAGIQKGCTSISRKNCGRFRQKGYNYNIQP